ncbi:MAG: hypothetical protein KAT70_09715, partial [Thermoplasmata archaeon]|nr:hypothetical protein [Thermoplasmata archaeon]
TANHTTSYHFVMNDTGFYDEDYDMFLNASLCNSTADNITFGISVDTIAGIAVEDKYNTNVSWVPIGLWEMVITVDGAEVHSDTIQVIYSELVYGRSTDDIVIRAEPYSTMEGELLKGRQLDANQGAAKITNTGNVPFKLQADFGAYEPYFNATNTSLIVYPGEAVEPYIYLLPAEWSPRADDFQVDLTAMPTGGISQQATVVLNSSYNAPLNVRIEVRLAGYEILDLGDGSIVLQYMKGPIALGYDVESNLDIYLSGTKVLDLSLKEVNITITNIEWKGSKYTPESLPLITLTNDTNDSVEQISITLKGEPGTTGFLIYDLESQDGTLSGNASTEFQTEQAPWVPPTEEDNNFLQTPLGLAVVGGGIGIFLLIMLLYASSRMKSKKGRKVEESKAEEGDSGEEEGVEEKEEVSEETTEEDVKKEEEGGGDAAEGKETERRG